VRRETSQSSEHVCVNQAQDPPVCPPIVDMEHIMMIWVLVLAVSGFFTFDELVCLLRPRVFTRTDTLISAYCLPVQKYSSPSCMMRSNKNEGVLNVFVLSPPPPSTNSSSRNGLLRVVRIESRMHRAIVLYYSGPSACSGASRRSGTFIPPSSWSLLATTTTT
jgi:hypothetical protein